MGKAVFDLTQARMKAVGHFTPESLETIGQNLDHLVKLVIDSAPTQEGAFRLGRIEIRPVHRDITEDDPVGAAWFAGLDFEIEFEPV